MDSQNELAPVFVNKVPQTTSDQHLILKTEWRSNEINIHILESQKSLEWEGDVSFDELKQSAEELEISFNTFFNECKEALTNNGGARNFQYMFEENKFTLLKKDQFEIQYLEIAMKPNSQPKADFALTAVDLIASLRQELSQCKETSKELNEKYQTVVTAMEKCLEEKNVLEMNLLTKFAVLLNSKKDKIAELQDLLVEKNNKLEDAGISGKEPGKRKSTDALADSDDSEEDFIATTQVMTQPETRTLPKRVKSSEVDVYSSSACKNILSYASKLPIPPEISRDFYDMQ